MQELRYISNIEKISENVYAIDGSSTIQLYYGMRKPTSQLGRGLNPSFDALSRAPILNPELAALVRSTTISDRDTAAKVSTHTPDPGHPIPHIDINMWVTGERGSNFYNRRLDKKGKDI